MIPTSATILRHKQQKGQDRKVTGRVSAILGVNRKGWCSNGGRDEKENEGRA